MEEIIRDYLYRERLENPSIVVFVVKKLTREVVDAWIGSCRAEMESCVASHIPIRILQDLSASNDTQTPYSREKGQILVDAYPELAGRIAFILPHTPDSQRVRLFVHRQEHQYRERRVFFTRKEAIAWLQEPLTP